MSIVFHIFVFRSWRGWATARPLIPSPGHPEQQPPQQAGPQTKGPEPQSRLAQLGLLRRGSVRSATEWAPQPQRGQQPARPEDPAPGRRPARLAQRRPLGFHSVFDHRPLPGLPRPHRRCSNHCLGHSRTFSGGRREQRGRPGGMAVSWRSWLANEGVKHLCLVGWRARLPPRWVSCAAILIHSLSVRGWEAGRGSFASNSNILN